jgi:hypothetical protein
MKYNNRPAVLWTYYDIGLSEKLIATHKFHHVTVDNITLQKASMCVVGSLRLVQANSRVTFVTYTFIISVLTIN